MRENGSNGNCRGRTARHRGVGHANTDMIDFLGQFGFDGIWLEGEHGLAQLGAKSAICHAPGICGA